MTTDLAAPPPVEQLLSQLKAAGYKCIEEKDFANALLAFRKIAELDRKDINARFVYAQLMDNGSHKTRAEARDLMLSILDEYPAILDEPTEGNLNLIRHAAVRCSQGGHSTGRSSFGVGWPSSPTRPSITFSSAKS